MIFDMKTISKKKIKNILQILQISQNKFFLFEKEKILCFRNGNFPKNVLLLDMIFDMKTNIQEEEEEEDQ